MRLADWILGKYLASSDDSEQRVGPIAGIPMLGLDALSSSAYGPEAALTVLLPLGALGLHYVLPISGAIIILLFIVFISYRQTIEAYPTGGGSYTVARENLGTGAALFAAAALMLDYVLTVAVGIAAGVGALVSVLPALQSQLRLICLIALAIITVVNLRGIKESGRAFMIPTYGFILGLLGVLALGLFRTVAAGGHPVPVEPLAAIGVGIQSTATTWLLLRAFASGCTAMTGVEAVSNGVRSFREPVIANARRTLSVIVVILIAMLAGIACLATAYGIGVTDSGQPGYESMISQLVRAIVGRGAIYFFIMAMVICVLTFSANTAFADFPRLCQIIAKDDYLPNSFAERGRRLVFSWGVIWLSILAGGLLFFFDGVTDRLIPLYAIGAFLAFTLSQAGMVVHWIKQGVDQNYGKLSINAAGAVATGATLVVVLVSKFTEGGWISAVLVPVLVVYFVTIHRHYRSVKNALAANGPIDFTNLAEPAVIVPIRTFDRSSRKALALAMRLSSQIYCIHVLTDEESEDAWLQTWLESVAEPARKAGAVVPNLITVKSPHRKLFEPFFAEIDKIEASAPDRSITIVIPNLVERRWYQFFLHNQRAVLLRAAILFRRDPKITLVTVPWYLEN